MSIRLLESKTGLRFIRSPVFVIEAILAARCVGWRYGLERAGIALGIPMLGSPLVCAKYSAFLLEF